VVGLLERALAAEQAVGDTAGIEARLRSLAEVAEHAMGDLARAAGYLRALWDVTSDAAVRERLHGLYVSLGDRGGELRLLGAELDRMAERAETMSQGRALAERLAELAAQAPPDWALQAKAWRFLADLAPTAPEPLERLARVLRAQGDFEAVLAALEARAALSDGPGTLQASRERAQVLTVELSRLDEAVLAWRGVLESSPDDDEALRYLQGIHKAQGDFEAEVAVLEQRIAAAEDPDVRVTLLHEAAVQAELRLGDAGRAVAALERVAEADPDDLDVADERLRLYADLGRHADYIALAEVRLKTLDDPEERLELARRVARTATIRSRDEAALLAWQRVDALRPGDDETLQAGAML
jgi:tetratricopeptide (TPR) repeat protein